MPVTFFTDEDVEQACRESWGHVRAWATWPDAEDEYDFSRGFAVTIGLDDWEGEIDNPAIVGICELLDQAAGLFERDGSMRTGLDRPNFMKALEAVEAKVAEIRAKIAP